MSGEHCVVRLVEHRRRSQPRKWRSKLKSLMLLVLVGKIVFAVALERYFEVVVFLLLEFVGFALREKDNHLVFWV